MQRRILLIAWVCTLCAVGTALPASAQTYRGTGSCVKSGCHKNEKTWYENEDGPPPNQHRAAYLQLTRDPAKSAKYAASIAVANPQDPAGRCVECHAPPQRARFADGVSCEVCHGPGSSYYDPHDDEPYRTSGYQKALTLGMLPLLENPAAWTQRCLTCHVVRESKLIEAGHPSGDDFDLAVKYRIVASPNGNHWKTNYAGRIDEIRRLAKQFGDPIRLARARTAPAVPAPPVPTPPVVTPPPTTIAPTPSPQPPAPAPAAAPTTPVGSGQRSTTAASTSPTPAIPRGSPPSARAGASPSAPPPPTTPMPIAPSPLTLSTPATLPPATGLPRSPAALVAAVQGRALELLNALLQRGAVVPARVRPHVQLDSYDGPDGELLRLQRDVLMLALDALGSAPIPPSPPKQ